MKTIVLILLVIGILIYIHKRTKYYTDLYEFRKTIKQGDICLFLYRDEGYKVRIIERKENTCICVREDTCDTNKTLFHKVIEVKRLYPIEE